MAVEQVAMSNALNLDIVNQGNTKKEMGNDGIFQSILDSSVNMISETNSYQKEAEKIQMDFVTGKTDDVLAVMMAQEAAMTSLNFTVQITNKVIGAYKEIMQIQL